MDPRRQRRAPDRSEVAAALETRIPTPRGSRLTSRCRCSRNRSSPAGTSARRPSARPARAARPHPDPLRPRLERALRRAHGRRALFLARRLTGFGDDREPRRVPARARRPPRLAEPLLRGGRPGAVLDAAGRRTSCSSTSTRGAGAARAPVRGVRDRRRRGAQARHRDDPGARHRRAPLPDRLLRLAQAVAFAVCGAVVGELRLVHAGRSRENARRPGCRPSRATRPRRPPDLRLELLASPGRRSSLLAILGLGVALRAAFSSAAAEPPARGRRPRPRSRRRSRRLRCCGSSTRSRAICSPFFPWIFILAAAALAAITDRLRARPGWIAAHPRHRLSLAGRARRSTASAIT